MDGEQMGLFSLWHEAPHLQLDVDIKKLLQQIMRQSWDNLGVYLQYTYDKVGQMSIAKTFFCEVLEVLAHV